MPNRKQGVYHKPRPKYNARKVATPYGTFDSKKEYARFLELKEMQDRGEIESLEVQPRFVLVPAQRDEHGRVIEKKAQYTADFSYIDSDGNFVVEDVKSEATRRDRDYVMRRKLMLWFHGIRIKEV